MHYSANLNTEEFLEQLSKLIIERENMEGFFLTPQICFDNNKKIRLYFQHNDECGNKTELKCFEI